MEICPSLSQRAELWGSSGDQVWWLWNEEGGRKCGQLQLLRPPHPRFSLTWTDEKSICCWRKMSDFSPQFSFLFSFLVLSRAWINVKLCVLLCPWSALGSEEAPHFLPKYLLWGWPFLDLLTNWLCFHDMPRLEGWEGKALWQEAVSRETIHSSTNTQWVLFIPRTFITECLAEVGPYVGQRDKNRPGHQLLLPVDIQVSMWQGEGAEGDGDTWDSTLTRPRVKNWFLESAHWAGSPGPQWWVTCKECGVGFTGPSKQKSPVKHEDKSVGDLKRSSHHWKAQSAGGRERTNGLERQGRAGHKGPSV